VIGGHGVKNLYTFLRDVRDGGGILNLHEFLDIRWLRRVCRGASNWHGTCFISVFSFAVPVFRWFGVDSMLYVANRY
jgi:hypothetical protein